MKNQSEDGLVRFGRNARGTLAAEHISGATCYVHLDHSHHNGIVFESHQPRWAFAGEVRHEGRVYNLAGLRSGVICGVIPKRAPLPELKKACEAAFSFAESAWEHQDDHGCSNPDTCPERG